MKKCASCTKDLPDAALHCVFCGAKQPPAPASSPVMAKTVMGYGNAELDALRAQASAARSASPSSPPATIPAPANLPAAAPYPAPRANPSQHPPMGNALAPAAPANAKTMFAGPAGPTPGATPMSAGPMPGPGPSAGAFQVPPPGPMGPGPMGPGPMGPGPMGPGPMGPGPMPSPSPMPMPQPAAAVPSPAPGYGAQPQPSAGRPIEPWRDSLRVMLFVWGALLLGAFATPLSVDPLVFNWDIVLEGEGAMKLPPLVIAAVGLLSIVIAATPLAAAARGAIAAVLGLTGVFLPVVLLLVEAGDALPVELLVTLLAHMVGMLLVVPGLLVRHEYREASLPRILVTVGAVLALAPFVIPLGGEVPLVNLFRAVIDAEGAGKVIAILGVLQIVVLVLTLLAWLPAPSSAGAKPLAWVLILWGLVMHAATLFLVGDPSIIEQSPYTGIASWIPGALGGAKGSSAGIGVAYLAIVGYGLASVIGKKLE